MRPWLSSMMTELSARGIGDARAWYEVGLPFHPTSLLAIRRKRESRGETRNICFNMKAGGEEKTKQLREEEKKKPRA